MTRNHEVAQPEQRHDMMWPVNRDDALRDEIYRLLDEAHRHDPRLEAFGAKAHSYRLGPPQQPAVLRKIERRHGFTFPADFFWFATTVGNGGAGPDYGLFAIKQKGPRSPLGKGYAGPFAGYQTARFDPVPLPCSPEQWSALVDAVSDDDDVEWDQLLCGGLLGIVESGCGTGYALLMSGPDAGKVVSTDADGNGPPRLPTDAPAPFLDWYLGWLREVAVGYQAGSYGFCPLGSPDEILAGYDDLDEAEQVRRLVAVKKSKRCDTSLSSAVTAKVLGVYGATDEPRPPQVSALGVTVDLGIEGWDAALRERITRPEWVDPCVLFLTRKYRTTGRFAPGVDDWYQTLVAAIPAAAQVSDTDDGRFALQRIVDMVAACTRLDPSDLPPAVFEAPPGTTTSDHIRGLARTLPIPPEHWPALFESLDRQLAVDPDDDPSQLRSALHAMVDLTKGAPALADVLADRYTGSLQTLAARPASGPGGDLVQLSDHHWTVPFSTDDTTLITRTLALLTGGC